MPQQTMPAGLGGPNRNGLAWAIQSGAKGAIDKILSIGAYPGETDYLRDDAAADTAFNLVAAGADSSKNWV